MQAPQVEGAQVYRVDESKQIAWSIILWSKSFIKEDFKNS